MCDVVFGFDCGFGNVLMDYWVYMYCDSCYDVDGVWACIGCIDEMFFVCLKVELFFLVLLFKSIGCDLFNLVWL